MPKEPKITALYERLSRDDDLMRENLDNGKEEFWQQKVFNENQWVLAQIFSCPLNAKQQKAFELYRSSFNNLTIITFDELHQKICDLMSVFKEDSPRPVDSLMDEFSIIDEDYPI